MTNTKKCLHCRAMMRRHGGEEPGKWARRKYCSKSCAARSLHNRARYVDSAPKMCPQCGAEFARSPSESEASWSRHTYCSRRCASRARRGGMIVRRDPRTVEMTAQDHENRANLLRWFVSRGRAKPGDDILEVITRTSIHGVREDA